MSAETESLMREVALGELMELKGRGYDFVEGMVLPSRREERINGKKMDVTILREDVRAGELHVVVRVDQKKMFGGAGMRIIEGCHMREGGRVTDMMADDLERFR